MCLQTFFFANFGPNATTFITPVELFTTKYRSTMHGISAACGKHSDPDRRFLTLASTPGPVDPTNNCIPMRGLSVASSDCD